MFTLSWIAVPPLTVAACGSTIASYLVASRPEYAFDILIASYVMLGLGACPAFSILVLYLQRLTLHHLPDKEVIVSTFLPLGPCGQSGFAAIQLGKVALQLFPVMAQLHPDSLAWQIMGPLGGSFYAAGLIFGLAMLGWGLWFAFLALTSIGTHYFKKSDEPHSARAVFHLGFWSTTVGAFPALRQI
jgi:tellurite resistance protein TehA-like permease